MEQLISVTEASQLLGMSPARVRHYIIRGRLPAQQVGRTWTLSRADVEAFATLPRLPGRPPWKEKNDGG